MRVAENEVCVLAAEILYDRDISIAPLQGKTIAVVGYGNQGQAHALNLRESGLQVVVGQRQGGEGSRRARADSFKPLPIADAAAQADLIILTLPDEAAPTAYREHIAPHLRTGQMLGFVHGFNIHYARIVPPGDVDVIMVAPKGAGYMVRRAFEEGRGLPCLVAVARDASGSAQAVALAWAGAIGGGRAGIIRTTFREETETDLFGEQVSVVGGVTALMQAAFETLVQAGYDPSHAYFECVHEVKYVVDLIHAGGMRAMLRSISKTAAYGGLSRADRLAAVLRPVMQAVLQEIRDGRFAREWIADSESGLRKLSGLAAAAQDGLMDRVGHELGILRDSPGGS